jgi:hypothetical protein
MFEVVKAAMRYVFAKFVCPGARQRRSIPSPAETLRRKIVLDGRLRGHDQTRVIIEAHEETRAFEKRPRVRFLSHHQTAAVVPAPAGTQQHDKPLDVRVRECEGYFYIR